MLSEPLNEAQRRVRSCILRGTTAVVVVVSIVVMLSSTYRWPVVTSVPWMGVAGGLLGIYLVGMIIQIVRRLSTGDVTSRASRADVALTACEVAGLTMWLATLAAFLDEDVVTPALLTSLGILVVMTTLSGALPLVPLATTLIITGMVAIVASVVCGIVFWRSRNSHAHTVSQLVLSGVFCVLCSLYISFDVEYYSRVCTGPRCCRMGVLSVWSDWANVLLRLLRLYDELSE